MYETREVKPFLCFECQYHRLISRGLIDDENNLQSILKNQNYYRFTGFLLKYKERLPNGNETYNNVKVSTVYKLQAADQALRMLLLNIISHVEISIRTYVAYTIGELYGPLGYENPNNFKCASEQEQLIKIIDDRKDKNYSVRFIRHHELKFDGKLPIWIVVELMTFDNLIFLLYNNLKKEAQDNIQKKFLNIAPKRLTKWLKQIRNLRNECAHFFRIFDRKREGILIPNNMKSFILQGSSWNDCSNTLFGYLCVMKYIINNDHIWNECFTDIRDYILDYEDVISLDDLGFPLNWEDVLDSIIN